METVLVQAVNGRLLVSTFKAENLEAAMSARGYALKGFAKSPRLRPELQGAPIFSGLCGPMWGGDETPWRYEGPAANDILSA